MWKVLATLLRAANADTTRGRTVGLDEIRRRAGQGEAMAQFNLGLMYDTGEGVEQDYAEALLWYRRPPIKGLRGRRLTLVGCTTWVKAWRRTLSRP